MSVSIHVPHQKLPPNDEFSEICCSQEHQNLCFVSDILSNSPFLCQPIFRQNFNNNNGLDSDKMQKIPFYQGQRDEYIQNVKYKPYVDESLFEKNSLKHQNMLISQSSYSSIPPNQPYNNLESCTSSTHEITTRQKFTKEEDEMLIKMVSIYGAKKWSRIASKIPGRTPRQCRDRYANYLAPGFTNSEWSLCEDILLVEKFSQYGSQWTLISHFFQGRTPNSIKNRWKYNVSRRVDSLLSHTKTNPDQLEISNSLIQPDFKKNEDQNLFIPLQIKLENKINDSSYIAGDQSNAFISSPSHVTYPSSFSAQSSLKIPIQDNSYQKKSKDNSTISAEKCSKMGKCNDDKVKSYFDNIEFQNQQQIEYEESKNDIWPLQYFDDDELFDTVSIFS